MKFETKLIHAGQEPDEATGSVNVPVYQTSTFKQDAIGRDRGWEYSRSGNPTRKALEDCAAALEGGKYGFAFASGMAAETAVLNLLEPGDAVIAGEDIYGGTYRLLEKVVKKTGVEALYADLKNPENLKKKLKKNVKLVWLESPANPLLSVCDLAAIAEICKKKKILLAADNTFATPYFQNPLALGADIVVHSSTKYLGGHSDVVGGLVVTSNEELGKRIKFYQNACGAIPGPWDAWLTLRGIKTLAVRMKRHEENAFAIAWFLRERPEALKVFFPGLPEHPGHETAKKQMRGFGGMVSFEIRGGYRAAYEFTRKLKLFSLADSLGGVESLACYPPVQTHASLSEKERLKRGINPGLIRLSLGIENKTDLLEDLKRAFRCHKSQVSGHK